MNDARNTDIEALARALWAADGMGDGFEKEREVYIEQASGLLASDWLAERERAAAEKALRDYAQLASDRERHMRDRTRKTTADGREQNVWNLVAHELNQRAHACRYTPVQSEESE